MTTHSFATAGSTLQMSSLAATSSIPRRASSFSTIWPIRPYPLMITFIIIGVYF